MDRLTEIYFDEFGIKHARLKDNIAKKTYRSYTWTPQEIANEKLAELEDFMEKHKCHSVGDLMLEFTISAVDKLNLKLTEEKLAEMKAKLAESERSKEINIKERDKICIEMSVDYNKQIYQLKQQLAETDKLMQEYLNKCLSLEEQLAEKEKEETKRMEDFEKGCQEYYKSNQTAIAVLEKVKDWVVDYSEIKGQSWNHTLNYLNKQIKELKGEN